MATKDDLLKEAQDIIKEQTDMLERLSKKAKAVGVIAAKLPGKKALLVGSSTQHVIEDPGFDVGTLVTIMAETGQAFKVADIPLLTGDVVPVINVMLGGSLEISANGSSHVVLPGQHKGLKAGDRVLIDASRSVVLEVVERVQPPKPNLAEPVLWDDVGGNDAAKQLLVETIEWPRKHPDLFKNYGHKPASGILLYGPPGCGKTMLGKCVATAMAKGKAGGFLNIKGPEILDPYVGVTEATVRSVFRKARDYYEEHGHEAVIFIDEADALLTARGRGGNFMGQTVVPAFLTEMDGLESTPSIVILSTNRPDTLDPAITRDGRIDFKIEIKRPTQVEGANIVDIHLSKTKAATKGLGALAADRLYKGPNAQLPHSGALFAGVVAKAKAAALRRDIAGKGKATGIREEDILHACEVVSHQELNAASYQG